jgi:hypothetical protein
MTTRDRRADAKRFLEGLERFIVEFNMRKAITLWFLVLASGVLIHAQTKTPRENERLIGPVRTMLIERATVSNVAGQPKESARVFFFSETFDEKGNLLAQNSYDAEEKREQKLGWGHSYDDKGRETQTLFYDADGRLTNTGVTVYNDKERRAETTQINPDGSINHIQAYFYDEKGNKIRESHRNADGTARNNIFRSYDDRRRVVEEIFYDGKGAMNHRSVMTYDDHGEKASWTVHKPDGTFVLMFKRSQAYDSKDRVTAVTYYTSDNAVTSKESFSYEDDAQGNWIKRTTSREVFKKDLVQSESEIVYRTLTYF